MTLERLFAGRGINVAASKARMFQLMADESLDYGDRTMTYNSRLAQELAAWAVLEKSNTEIHRALFRAYFVECQNLSQIDVLTVVADSVGLNVSEATDVLTHRSMKHFVDADWRRCYEFGVSGVPTFRIEDELLVGAQPFEQLEAFVIRNS